MVYTSLNRRHLIEHIVLMTFVWAKLWFKLKSFTPRIFKVKIFMDSVWCFGQGRPCFSWYCHCRSVARLIDTCAIYVAWYNDCADNCSQMGWFLFPSLLLNIFCTYMYSVFYSSLLITKEQGVFLSYAHTRRHEQKV